MGALKNTLYEKLNNLLDSALEIVVLMDESVETDEDIERVYDEMNTLVDRTIPYILNLANPQRSRN